MTSPDKKRNPLDERKKCPHKDLEFEAGGRMIVCRDCQQEYHAGAVIHGMTWAALDNGYYNGNILHKERRTWAPALAPKPPVR